jgi:hypothetical protein
MKTIYQAICLTVGAGIFSAIFVSNAVAGCGDLSGLQGPFQFVAPQMEAKAAAPRAASPGADDRGGQQSASIAGMWDIQLISRGNTGHNPSIPDGALIDFGYTQWHSDGTEIQNSAGVPGGGFCLGVWGQTGFLTFELNHFPIAFNPTSGAVAAYINIREQVTLSPSGDSYTGTFTEDVYDPIGDHVDHLTGTVVGTRMTVDSSLPSAIPRN